MEPIAGLWPEIRSSNSEIRNETKECQMTDSSTFYRVYLKKQSQLQNGQNDVKSVLIMSYGDFDGPRRRKNKANSKPNKANLPGFSRKSEARNPKRVDRVNLKKQSVRQGKLVQFSRYESCPAKD
jgi:hypothetical protein